MNHPGTTGTDEDVVRFETQNGGDLKFQASDLSAANPAWKMYTPGGEEIIFGTNNTNALRINTSQRILIGTDTSRTVGQNVGKVQIEDTGQTSVSLVRNSADAEGPLISLASTRGTAVGDSTIVQNGDRIGRITFGGGGMMNF